MQSHTQPAGPADPALRTAPSAGELALAVCHSCREPAAPGAKLRFCGECRVAAYCSAACQSAAWEAHKRVCSHLGENNQMSRAAYAACKAGGGGSRQANLQSQEDWYVSIPGLLDKVMCLAWLHRGEYPIIQVATSPDGTDARAPKLTMVPRSVWRADPNTRAIDEVGRCRVTRG